MSMPLVNQSHPATDFPDQPFGLEDSGPKPLSVAFLSPGPSGNQDGWLNTTALPSKKFYLRAYLHESIEGLYWVVGTEDWVDVRLPIRTRTPFYFVIEREYDSWLLHSQDHMPPLLVNGEPVQVAWIEDGDEIAIGGFSFVFNITHRNQASY